MYKQDLDFALTLADAADKITLPRFEANDLVIESKPDMTPVSDADLECEKVLRSHIGDAEILGEEFGGSVQFHGRQCILHN